MREGSRQAIWVGIAATLAIAATKFAAAGATGSSAMIAEGVHSIVDTSDGFLLLLGLHQARKPPDVNHPFGHGKELYFWALIVAILFFAVGGGMSAYEGIQHLVHPEGLTSPGWNYLVLAAALAFTAGSLWVAYRQFRARAGATPFWRAIHVSKDPTLFTLILEDGADIAGVAIAFAGIFLAHTFRMPRLDGVASIGVGLVMAAVAIVLARESKGLLIGEGADRELLLKIRHAAERDPAVVAVQRPVTMHFGPHDVLAALRVEFQPQLSSADVARAIDRLQRDIKEEAPDVRHIYIEVESITRGASDASIAASRSGSAPAARATSSAASDRAR